MATPNEPTRLTLNDNDITGDAYLGTVLVRAVNEWPWVTVIPPVIQGKVKRKKARKLNLPTEQHRQGTVAHTTVNGQGKIARLK